ncbi:hypothetical protein LQF12_05995 [Ruania suaedae]|uniref:hypothetical protein n=1 Tax=Ruania suaedae TaxID=2897774 RepID=UPI001E5948CA|nr:hypothetical protein [Ruania suaedae]UFU04137.1 hypothetical protein LQF12_05995 [Ruania suaedae]
MTGVLLVLFAAISAAFVLLIALLLRRLPEEGLRVWLRESVAGLRRETGASAPADLDRGRDLLVADLMAMAEDGEAYHRPVDLGSVVKQRSPS